MQKARVAEYKKRIVMDIVNLVKKYPIIGAVNMENLPAQQLQKIRAQLRDKLTFSMTKKRFMKIALEKAKDSKKDVEKLYEYFTGMPALIFTNENPFKLSRKLKKNKSPAPAKAGQIAPNDIIVPAGPTSFVPGPIIGELGQIGIKAGVEGGKVAIKKESVVAKKGDKIKPKVAEILTRLGIEPMEVGLDLVAVYENGTIYTKNILDTDEDKFMTNLKNAADGAFNLAMFVAYPTKDTISFLISKAFNEAKALGLSQEIIDEGIINYLLAKAQEQMLGLSSIANFEVHEKPKEAKLEEKIKVKEERFEKPKAEEKKIEEVKKEVSKKEKKSEAYAHKVEEKKVEDRETEKKKREEEKRKAEEERKKQEELRKQEEAKKAEEEKKKQELQKRIEEDKRKAEELRKKKEEEQRELEEKKRAEEQKDEAEKKEAEIDIKVKKMVEKTKRMAKGPGPSAADILEYVEREHPKTKKKEEAKEETNKEQPETERLVKELQRKGTLRGVKIEDLEKEKPTAKKEETKTDEQKKAEELFNQLKKKGTLRGSK